MVRAYAMDWPMCSWLCTRRRRYTPSAVVSPVKNLTFFCRSALGYAARTASCEDLSHFCTSALAVTVFSPSFRMADASGGIVSAGLSEQEVIRDHDVHVHFAYRADAGGRTPTEFVGGRRGGERVDLSGSVVELGHPALPDSRRNALRVRQKSEHHHAERQAELSGGHARRISRAGFDADGSDLPCGGLLFHDEEQRNGVRTGRAELRVRGDDDGDLRRDPADGTDLDPRD